MNTRLSTLPLLATLVLGACTPVVGSPAAGEASAGSSQQQRAVTLLTRAEPPSLAGSELHYTGVSVSGAVRPFQAALVLDDGHDNVRPYLAEAVPQLNTSTWLLLPDGRMETTYRLKPNLTWHDGTRLTAEDYVYGWRVYATPEFGANYVGGRVQSIAAPDNRTVVVQWRAVWAGAGTTTSLKPLPRHILEQPFEQSPPEAFLAHSYWKLDYVGLGPYKLDQWEPGAYIQGTAFDGHVLGRPKIDRLFIRFSPDENTALANILAESVHVVTDRSIRYEQASVLKNEWRVNDKGVTVLTPSMNRWMVFQSRSDYANPAALLDLRTRKAIVHAIDRDALNEGLFTGDGVMSPTVIRPTKPYYADVDRSITKYAYDPRRTEQLMAEVGYTKGSDGVFVSATGERFNGQLMNQAGIQPERETTIMQETWRRAGFDISAYIVPVSQSTDSQARATFPSMQNASGGSGEESKLITVVNSAQVGTPQNRWMGDNRGGWSNPEYDRLASALDASLDTAERARYVVQMEKIISDQLPIMHLFFNFGATAYLSVLEGPDRTIVSDSELVWNIHEWHFR